MSDTAGNPGGQAPAAPPSGAPGEASRFAPGAGTLRIGARRPLQQAQAAADSASGRPPGRAAPPARSAPPARAAEAPGGQPAADPGGISLAEAVKRVGEQRRARDQAPPGQPGPAAAPNGAAPAAQPREASPVAEKPAETGAESDPFAAMLQGAQPAAPNGAAAAPAAEGDAITLTVGGQAQRYTQAELAAHVSKSLDYTQKTQALSNVATEINKAKAVLGEVMPLVLPYIERMIAEGEGGLGAEPNWVELVKSDPGKYLEARARWDMAQAERQKLDRLRSLQSMESEEVRRNRIVQGHRQIVSMLPGWENPDTRTKMQGAMREWATRNGYAPAEMDGVTEAKHVITIAKAMMFDRMMGGVKTDAPVIPTVQRGASMQPGRPPSEEVERAEQAFASRANVNNAAALLSARRRARGG